MAMKQTLSSIKKKLIFGEVLFTELEPINTLTYITLKSDKSKQMYHKILFSKT